MESQARTWGKSVNCSLIIVALQLLNLTSLTLFPYIEATKMSTPNQTLALRGRTVPRGPPFLLAEPVNHSPEARTLTLELLNHTVIPLALILEFLNLTVISPTLTWSFSITLSSL